MGEGRAAVALERAEQRIRVDLVTDGSQKAAAVITAKVVAVRGDRASIIKDVHPQHAGFQDGIPDLEPCTGGDAAAVEVSPVSADRAVLDSDGTGAIHTASEKCGVVAKSAVGDGQRAIIRNAAAGIGSPVAADRAV